MLEAIIVAFIWCAVIMIVAYAIVWGLGYIIPDIPAQIIKLIWFIAALLCLLVLIGVLIPLLPPLRGRG